ncbi:uncharacterized protein LOC143914135 [Arctopsyche grandis]|uniref:uncharacterized protein LOC143914135 n=1 Tax=Arctopsyche grandis TaxID=121162 RepID=UPI00406D663B
MAAICMLPAGSQITVVVVLLLLPLQDITNVREDSHAALENGTGGVEDTVSYVTYFVLCVPDRPTNIAENQTTPASTTVTIEISTTTTSWTSITESSTTITRLPMLLRLGNQTVDINKSFRVPQAVGSSNASDVRNSSEIIVKKSVTTVSNVSTDVNISVSTASPKLKPWQGTKHEHEGRYGPQFEDAQTGENITVIIQAGDTALFDCRVSLLRDKTVSWLKRQPGEPPLLLTVGAQTYTGDSRFTVQFRYPGNWRLQITSTNASDEGLYECQLSTHPPRVISVYLRVRTMFVAIVDESGEALREQYYEAGSTLSLKCRVRGSGSTAGVGGEVWWFHGSVPLHRDASRGGVGVRSVALAEGAGADSHLKVSRLAPPDAGNYTCAVPHAMHHAYTVLVHVLNESLAELQQGSSNEGPRSLLLLLAAAVAMVLAAQDGPS